MQTDNQPVDEKAVLAGALTRSTKATVAPFNPMEQIATFAIGEEVQEGMTLCGVYEGPEVIASHKFTYSQTKNEEGVPTSTRFIFKNPESGVKFGLWSSGELKMAFSKILPGTYVEVKYVGKGVNSKGQAQHNFEIKTDRAAQ